MITQCRVYETRDETCLDLGNLIASWEWQFTGANRNTIFTSVGGSKRTIYRYKPRCCNLEVAGDTSHWSNLSIGLKTAWIVGRKYWGAYLEGMH